MTKKEVRKKFRDEVFKRDQYSCRKCGLKTNMSNYMDLLDAHHICNRNEMIDGGYDKRNGISLCGKCHEIAEEYHSSGKTNWKDGCHPNDLYEIIGTDHQWVKDNLKSF